MSIIVHKLDHGWSFRQADDDNHEWLPVTQVPTNLHLDLLKHRKYVNLVSTGSSLTFIQNP